MSFDTNRAFDPHRGIEDRMAALYQKNEQRMRVYAYLARRAKRSSKVTEDAHYNHHTPEDTRLHQPYYGEGSE